MWGGTKNDYFWLPELPTWGGARPAGALGRVGYKLAGLLEDPPE